MTIGYIGPSWVQRVITTASELNRELDSKRTSTPTIDTATAFPTKDGTLQMMTSSLRSKGE